MASESLALWITLKEYIHSCQVAKDASRLDELKIIGNSKEIFKILEKTAATAPGEACFLRIPAASHDHFSQTRYSLRAIRSLDPLMPVKWRQIRHWRIWQ